MFKQLNIKNVLMVVCIVIGLITFLSVPVVFGGNLYAPTITCDYKDSSTNYNNSCLNFHSEPDYKGYFESSLKDLERGALQLQLTRNQLRSNGLHYIANMIASETVWWRWSGDESYARQATTRIQTIIDIWKEDKSRLAIRDFFFVTYPLVSAYEELVIAGFIDKALQDDFRAMARDMFAPHERGDHNRAICAATGLIKAANVFPDLPESQKWRNYAENVWDDWYGHMDTTENATNYNGIFLVYVFLLAEELNRTHMLLEPGVREVFDRFQKQVSPGGVIPDYGDSYPYSNWAYFVSAFEGAAILYDEPSFRWTAHQMFLSGSKNFPHDRATHPTRRILPLYHLSFAYKWQNKELEAVLVPVEASEVLTRKEPGDDNVYDKLILAPSRKPGAPFLMTELFGRGEHAHPKWGAVLFYEVQDIPLLHGLGYHNRAPSQGNIFLMKPEGEEFPFTGEPFIPGTWNEAFLPTRALMVPDASQYKVDYRHLSRITFRVESNAPVDLYVSNLRLEGPGGVMPIDDFREDTGWSGGQRRQFTYDQETGRHLMKVSCGSGITFIFKSIRGFIDVTQYTHFRFSWKMSDNTRGWAEPFILRVRTGTGTKIESTDYNVPLEQLFPMVKSATVSSYTSSLSHIPSSSHASSSHYASYTSTTPTDLQDSYGEMHFAQWFTYDTEHIRRMVLTKEGILIVRDDILPGDEAHNYSAGPIWHMHSLSESGLNWYSTSGDDIKLLIYFEENNSREIDMKNIQLWGGHQPYTVFAREKLESHNPLTFVTVLLPYVPHDPEISSLALAENIKVEKTNNNGRAITILFPDKQINIYIGDDGTWTVKRKQGDGSLASLLPEES